MDLEAKLLQKILEINAKFPPSPTHVRIWRPDRLNELLTVTKYWWKVVILIIYLKATYTREYNFNT